MKKTKSSSRLALATLITAVAPLSLSAQDLYWDLNNSTTGAGVTPAGVWDTSALNWNTASDGTSPTATWVDGSAAFFSAGTDSTGAYSVNVATARTASAVTVEEGDITFTGAAITVSSPGKFTINSGARVSIGSASQISSSGGVVLNGGTLRNTNPGNAGSFLLAATPLIIGEQGGTVDYTSSGTGTVSIYAGVIQGTGTLTKTGPNEFRYNGNNSGNNRSNTTFTKLVVEQGLFRLGSVSGFDTELGFGAAPSSFTADAITLRTGGAIGTSFAVTLNANRGITLGVGGGVINATAAAMTIPGAVTGSGSLTSTGTVTLSGQNTYTGGTIVNSGTLSATGSSALGATSGSLSVNNANTGAGNTVTLNLSNSSPTITGSLSGVVATPASGANVARIVTSGSQAFIVNQTVAGTFAGTITGNGSFTLGSLSTTALTLSGANTYTGGTTVEGGSLIASGAAAALGTGDVTVASSAVKLTIQEGVLNAIADTSTLSLAGGGVAGTADSGFLELGLNVNETVNMLSLGGSFVSAGTYGSTASNAMFKNDEFFSGPGIVTVAVPEPGSSAMLVAGFGTWIGFRRRSRQRC